jgi:hypothetical protein
VTSTSSTPLPRGLVRRVLTALTFAFVLARGAVAAATPPPLTVTFTGHGVHIDGATAGGQVAVVARMREASREMLVRMTEVHEMLRDSGSGALDYDLGRQLPFRSIWAVVDVATGRYVVVSPPGFERQEILFPATVVKNTPAAEADDELLNDRFVLDMLWVHPADNSHGGAWFARVADGGATDLDAKNDGKTLSATSQFRALGNGGAPPKKIKKGDILVMIDPFEMQFFATEVAK